MIDTAKLAKEMPDRPQGVRRTVPGCRRGYQLGSENWLA